VPACGFSSGTRIRRKDGYEKSRFIERLQRGRRPVLTRTRWVLLKRRANQTREERARLRELVQHNLRAVRAMLLREWFDHFWHYRSLDWAGAFLDEWCVQVMRSRLEPMKNIARMLRRHRALVLNWFRARGEISAAIVEGFNNKAKLTARKAYGFRSFKCLAIALYHTLGQLPEPETTHRFC
jgi:transposase